MKISCIRIITDHPLLVLLFYSACSSFCYSEKPDALQEKLKMYAEEKVKDFKIGLHRKLEQVRIRRQLPFLGDEEIILTVPTISFQKQKLNLILSPVTSLCTIKIDESNVAFASTTDNEIVFIKNFTAVKVHKFPSYQKLYSVQGFHQGNRLWLIGLYHASQYFIQVYEFDGNILQKKQKILLSGKSIIATSGTGNKIYISVVTSKMPYSLLNIFEWTGTQFDSVFKELKTSCKAVAMWRVNMRVYVLLSYTSKNKSELISFNTFDKELHTVQYLEISPYIIKDYNVAGNQFMICGIQNVAVIYWWSGTSLLMMQEIFSDVSKTVTDISIINVSNEIVILAIAWNDEAEFFAQDSSGHYVRNIDFKITESFISISIWNIDANVIYLLPLTNTSHLEDAYQLQINYKILSSTKQVDDLLNCMTASYDHLKERTEKIEAIASTLDKIWLMETSPPISSLIVNGSVATNGNVDIGYVMISNYISIDSSSVLGYFLSIQNKKAVLEAKLGETVFKSKIQKIKTNVHFSNIVQVDGSIDRLLNHVNLNGISTSHLSSTLKIGGKQTFMASVTLESGITGNISASLLNEKPIADYIQLRGGYSLSGNYVFKKVSLDQLQIASNKINGIDIKDFVLPTRTQNLTGYQKFSALSSNMIDSHGHLNKKNLTEIELSIVTLDSDKISNRINFTSEVIVDGDINVNLINGINISHLAHNAMQKIGTEALKGIKNFTSLNVKTMNLLWLANGFNLNELVLVNTPQIIFSDIECSKVTFSEIGTKSFNGLDLSNAAIKKIGHYFIENQKTFSETLKTSNVFMSKSALINSIDPSFEASRMYNVSDIEFSQSVQLRNVVVPENIEYEEAFGFPLIRLSNEVWRKSSAQNISFIHTKKLIARDVKISKLNNITIEDLVLVNNKSRINSSMEFKDVVNTNSVTLHKGKNILFPSLSLAPGIKVEVSEVTAFQDMEIKGNLFLHESLNNITLFDLMKVHENQFCTSDMNFDNIYLNALFAKNIKLHLFQQMNFSKYLEDFVPLSPYRMVSNKSFRILKGITIDNLDFINGSYFKNASEDFITLNTFQTLSKDLKLKDALIMKKITVDSFFGSKLSDVVFVDAAEHISGNKSFVGKTSATTMEAFGNISGIDISYLQMNAFFKHRNNSVTKLFTFQSSIDVTEIQLGKLVLIDSTDLANVIVLKEDVSAVDIHSSNIAVKNIQISGLINGCSLSDLSSAVFLKKSEQSIGQKNFNTLKIDGSLNVKRFLNKINLQQVVSSLASNEVYNSSFNFETLSAENLEVSSYINGIDLKFIFKDAVGKERKQVIGGKKNFITLHLNDAFIKSLAVEGTLCGINIRKLYFESVKKKGKSSVQLNKLKSITARNITLKGFLNKSTFPNDFVLISSAENITFPVIINNTINASSGVEVSGIIEDVELRVLINKRISLSTDENVSSSLVFLQDTVMKGKSKIKKLNGLMFNTFLTTTGNLAIKGVKTFTEHLLFNSNLNVKFVNSISMKSLENLLDVSQNETLFNVVQFSKMKISTLVTDRINGEIVTFLNHSVHEMDKNLSTFHDVLTHRICSTKEFIESTFDLHSSNPISFFGFFELHQILNFGRTLKFLPVLESAEGSFEASKLVLWIKNKACKNVESAIMDVLPDGMLKINKTLKGRIFPFVLRLQRQDTVGFYLKTEDRNRCTAKEPESAVITVKINSKTPRILPSPINSRILDAKLLETEYSVYLIVSYSAQDSNEKIHLFQYDVIEDSWSLSQKFFHHTPTSFNIFEQDENYYLAVTGGNDNPGIFIYEWNKDTFELRTNTSKSVSTAAIWVNSENIFLLLAKEKSTVQKDYGWVDVYSKTIDVYLFQDDLVLDHTIDVKGICSLETFDLAGETFVLASSHHLQTVYIIQYRGYNGFQVIKQFPAPGVISTTVFASLNNDLLLAISSSTGHTKILKAAIRGGRYFDD